MAKTLTLRDVPEPVIKALRERARRNHRSMQKELMSVLLGTVMDRGSLAQQLAHLRDRVGAAMSVDEIHRALEEGRP